MASVPIPRVSERLLSIYRRTSEARWALASQIVTSGANFATTVVVIRAAGIAEFGRFSVAFLILMTSRNFLNGLVLTPMSAIGPKLHGSSAGAYRGFLLANGAAFGVSTSLLLLAFAYPLGWALDSPWLPELAVALAFANITATAADFFRRYLFVQARSAGAFGIDLTRFAIQLCLVGWLALAPSGELRAGDVLFASAAGSAMAALLGLSLVGPLRWRPSLNRALWPRHWRFIKWMTAGVGLEAVQANAPLFIGAALLGEAAIGATRAVQQLTNLLNLPRNAVQQIAPSQAARLCKAEGIGGARRELRRLTILAICAVAPLNVFLIAVWNPLSHELLRISPSDTLATLILFSLYSWLTVWRAEVAALAQAAERPGILTSSAFLAIAISVGSSLLCVPILGIDAVPLSLAAATLVSGAYVSAKLNDSQSQPRKMQ